MSKTIKVYVEGGVVMRVTNLPDNYNYIVIDYDCQGDCDPTCLACEEKDVGEELEWEAKHS
tara:strand:+ start:433 stop:615 length:183 start_codon:yes stop_codon:yes gene_type:complete